MEEITRFKRYREGLKFGLTLTNLWSGRYTGPRGERILDETHWHGIPQHENSFLAGVLSAVPAEVALFAGFYAISNNTLEAGAYYLGTKILTRASDFMINDRK